MASVAVCAVWLGAVLWSGDGNALAAQAAAQSTGQAPRAAGQAVATTPQQTLEKYCLGCHSEAMKQRGAVPVAFDRLDLSNLAANAATWETIDRKVRTGLMPPAGVPRPDKASHDAFVGWIARELDGAAAARPNPGRTEPFHRLNRNEYGNVIRDLLALDVNVSALLPADDASYGFDNIAGVLKMSPTLMDRYLSAAQKISRMAVGTAPPVPNVEYYRVSDDLRQDDHLDGLPLGTRGGIAIKYSFPMDAEYVIRPRLARDVNESLPLYLDAQQLEVSVDGQRVQMLTVPGVSTPQGAAGGRGAAPPASGSDQLPAAGVAPARAGGAADGAAPPATGAAPAGGAQGGAQGGAAARPRPAISQIEAGLRVSGAEREMRNRIDEKWDVRVPLTAGEHVVTIAFIKKTSALDETTRLPFLRPYPAAVNTPETRMGLHLRSVEIVGPYAPTGAGSSASRQRIFVCTPGATVSQNACARTILSTLARRAYRRPVTDQDLRPLLAMYDEGRGVRQAGAAGSAASIDAASFDAGIELALKRLLVSPEFLYRVERDPSGIAPNTPYRISDLELASRLSFFLWSSMPDDPLIDLAVKGQLRTPAVLAAQVSRMLEDPRSEAFTRNFAGQWLYLRNLPSTAPVATAFPDFDESLRRGFGRETELFFQSIVREDRPVIALLTADYTYLDERLARHYGIPGVKGSQFRRVTLGRDSARSGLLGHGSILTVTSQPDRTSPVVRGKWILENFLGTSPPPPPPNVPDLRPSVEPGAVLSMRDRMRAHRVNPVCSSCHTMMDPIGLSLENFDAVGRARTLGESSTPIDASGVFPDGTAFTGASGLRHALLARSDQFVATATEKLLTYAVGRGLEYYDQPAVRAIVRGAAANDYRFASGLILGVAQSTPFQMRRSRP